MQTAIVFIIRLKSDKIKNKIRFVICNTFLLFGSWASIKHFIDKLMKADKILNNSKNILDTVYFSK